MEARDGQTAVEDSLSGSPHKDFSEGCSGPGAKSTSPEMGALSAQSRGVHLHPRDTLRIDHSENIHTYLMGSKNPFVILLYYIIRKGTEFQKIVTEIIM